MSRKPGERIWEGSERQYDAHTKLPVPEPGGRRKTGLVVEELAMTPPHYLVSDQHGNQWYVIIATDGVPEITESSSEAHNSLKARVIKAVERKLRDT